MGVMAVRHFIFVILLALAVFAVSNQARAAMQTITPREAGATSGETLKTGAQKINANFSEHEGEINALSAGKADKDKTIRDWSDHPDDGTTIAAGTPIWYGGKLYNTTQAFNKVSTSAPPDVLTVYFEVVTGSGGGIAHATSDGAYYASRNGAWANLAGAFVATETDPVFSAWDKDYADLINTPAIPAALADLGDDATHRIVTDAEKSAWNAKLGALPSWLPSTGPTNGRQIMQATGGCSDETYATQATCEAASATWTTPAYVNTSVLSGLINDAGVAADDLWSAAKITTMLEGLASATHNHAGTYELADATIIKIPEIDSPAEFAALLGWSPATGGSIPITEVDSDPVFESMATGDTVVSKTSGDLFIKTSTGGYTIEGVYTADSVTYGLTVDFVGVTGADKITLGGTEYSTDTTIAGLVGSTAITVAPDIGRTGDCVGTGITGSTPSKSADMSTDRSMVCTFAASDSPFTVGFQFQADSTTPVTNNTYVAGDTYPTSRVPSGQSTAISFGWNQAPADRNNRSTGVAILNGDNEFTNNYIPGLFRVDLPAAGTYKIWIGLGDQYARSYQYLQILDDSTVVATIDKPSGTLAGQYYDATGALSTSAADWYTNYPTGYITHTFSSAVLYVKVGATAVGSGPSTLSFLGVSNQ